MGYKYRHRIADCEWSEWSEWRAEKNKDWTVQTFLKNEYLRHKSVTRSETGGLVWLCTDETREKRFNPFWQIIFDTPDMLTQELMALELKEKNEIKKSQ